MRILLLVAAVALIKVQGQPIPPHPQLLGTFIAQAAISVNATDRNTGHPLVGTGSGRISRDEDAGRAVQIDTFVQPDLQSLNVWELERWDIKRRFAIENGGDCLSFAVAGPMPHVWDWVRRANYAGNVMWQGKEVQRWVDRDSWTGIEREVGVTGNEPKTPVWYELRDRWGKGEYKYLFTSYMHIKPAPSDFDIPRKCPTPVL
jgi:hypothetical protein